jgi:hypothetical protein
MSAGSEAANSTTRGSTNGERTSSEQAMDMRSPITRLWSGTRIIRSV